MSTQARPPSRRAPLGEATRRINNSQQLVTRPRASSKVAQMPHHESLRQDGLLQVIESPVSQVDQRSRGDQYRSSSPGYNAANPRLSAISKNQPVGTSNRNSQVSTASTNASDGKRIKACIGPWKLGKTLGKGATARVRLARHAFTGQQAAIKIVQKKNAQMSQAGSLAAFDRADTSKLDVDDGIRRMPVGIEREVAIMKLIQHPNIMKLYDIWENRTEIYLVLEYVDNGELFEHITANGRLEEEEAIKYFRQMLSAVGYCHSFNICHRDLKPENILLTKDLTIKIADFGMAALHQGPDHKLKTSCGSPHYAAPELIRGSQYHGAKVDIWSMGVILFATLAGRLPFDVDGAGKDWLTPLLNKIKLGEFEMSPEFSLEACNLIWRILQVNPRNRIEMKQIWNHALIRKYDYLDDYQENSFPLSPTIKTCGRPVLRRSDIHKDLLRQLRSMWHRLSEDDLMKALLSEEANEQKLFYSLLLKYRDAQLENYVPDPGYPSSDYHHVKPLAMTKTYSTRHFPQASTKGHGRQASRFTVISNVAETEQSYDPFKASRPQHLNTRVPDLPRVTIHRARTSDDCDNARPSTGVRQDSNTSFSYAGTSDRNKYKKAIRPRGYASRSSLASSTRSRGSASYIRVSIGHTRGVSFNHLRHRGLSKHHSNHTEVTDNDGDTLRPVAEYGTSTQYIRSKKGMPEAVVTPVKQPGRTSQIWKDDVLLLSSSLAKDCDEAFRTREVAEKEEIRKKNSVRLEKGTGGSKQINSTFLAVPPVKSHRSSWEDRPLPPPPVQSHDVKTELAEARKQAELRKASGGSDSHGYLDRMVSHIDRLIQPTVPVAVTTERRTISAPVDSRVGKPSLPMPSIFESELPIKGLESNDCEEPNLHADVKNNRVASAPEPRTSSTHDRLLDFEDGAKQTIRLVQSESPVKAPAPLTIRKLGSRSGIIALQTRNSGFDKVLLDEKELGHGRTDEKSQEFVQNSNSGSIVKKKTPWFKRTSKASDEHEWRMSIGGANAPMSNSSGNDMSGNSHHETVQLPIILPVKKRFSIGRLFRKRSTKADMKALVNESNDKYDQDSFADSDDDGRLSSNGRRVSNPDETKTRQIEPHRNWLARLFNVKPAVKHLCLATTKVRARQEVVRLLKEWKRYGIRDVQVDKARNIVFGRVAAKNFLDMKEVHFAGEFMTVIEHGKSHKLSIARFTQERGAASSFHKVVDTLQTILKARGMLVNDDGRAEYMVATLKGNGEQ